MKKGIKLLLSLLLFLPVLVLADAIGPDFITYEVEVVKDEGIDYYNYIDAKDGNPSGHLDKGTRIKIEFDAKYNGERFLYGIYEKKGIYVKEKDVVAVGEINTDNSNVLDTGEDNKIKITDEVIVRKGPAESFPEAGKLKKAETTFRYLVPSSNYIYVDYKGVKGWIKGNEEGLMYGLGDIITYESINSGECGTIPKSTVFKDVWVPGMFNQEAELEYKDNCKFTVDVGDLDFATLAEVKKVYKANQEISFRSDDDKRIVISEGDEFTVLSDDIDDYYYVEVGKDKGWLEVDLEEDATYVRDLKEKKQHKDDDEDEEKDTNVIVLACVVGGVAFALGAITTLILLNRKKKNEKKD